jgi:hypothetical protein
MTDTTWTGNLNSDYSNPTNWNNAVPTGTNNGVFDANGKHQSTILVGSALEFAGGWIFNGGAYTITVSVTEVIFQGLGVQVNAGIPNINVTSNSTLVFQNNSDGGGAAYSLDNNNIIDFHSDANSKVSLGSINAVFGSTIQLGTNQQLKIGSNGLSSVVAGGIEGLGNDSLVKVGAGTLTLAATNANISITSMTVDGGVLAIGGVAPYIGVSLFAFGHSGATLSFVNAALPGNNLSVPIHGVDWGDAIDLPGLPFKAGTTTASYDPGSHHLIVTNGSTTDTFNDVEGSANQYFALSDQHGGTRVMLAIIESRSHKHLDSKHAPPGQPAPSQPGQLLVALGKNDVVKGVGGNNILVGGAHNDVLFAAPGDTFAFVSLNASPPGKHHDTIMHFHQHDGEMIDLSAFEVGGQPLVFIHGSFKVYNHKYGTLDMVRVEHVDPHRNPDHASSLVQVTTNGHSAQFEVAINGQAPHVGDFFL